MNGESALSGVVGGAYADRAASQVRPSPAGELSMLDSAIDTLCGLIHEQEVQIDQLQSRLGLPPIYDAPQVASGAKMTEPGNRIAYFRQRLEILAQRMGAVSAHMNDFGSRLG